MKYSVLPSSWEALVALALAKYDYEVAVSAFYSQSRLRCAIARLTGKWPKDPAPGYSSEDIALRYVKRFNEEYRQRLQKRNLGYGCTLGATLRYQAEDRLPVFTVAYVEDGTGYMSRTKIGRNGAYETLPVPYPQSEVCLGYLPERKDRPELDEMKKWLPVILDKLRAAVVG